MVRIKNNKMEQVISFSREKNGNKIVSITNLSNQPVTVALESQYDKGVYSDLFSGQELELKGKDVFALDAWGYKVLVKK